MLRVALVEISCVGEEAEQCLDGSIACNRQNKRFSVIVIENNILRNK